MPTQKAYGLHAYDEPDNLTLDEVPMPTPGERQVLVAVSIVAVNPFDWKIRDGYTKEFLPLQLPVILGADFVGTVAALGEGASRFEIGDRVMTLSTSLGAFAEYIAVDEANLARVPDALSDTDAATLPMPGLTAWAAVHAAGELKPGMKVLIHGASGTAGALAVQFVKAAGAHVIGTASGKNRDYVMGLGADEFIDYQTERFEDRVNGADLVLDFVLVGGAMSTTDRSWKVLKPNGSLVSVADPSFLSRVPDGYHGFAPEIRPDAARLEELAEQLVDGRLKTKVARVFRRDELNEALELNKAGGSTGRLLVNFKDA